MHKLHACVLVGLSCLLPVFLCRSLTVSILDFDLSCNSKREYTLPELPALSKWRDRYEDPLPDLTLKYRRYTLKLDFKLHQAASSLGCVFTRDCELYGRAEIDKPFPVDLDISQHPAGAFPVVLFSLYFSFSLCHVVCAPVVFSLFLFCLFFCPICE